MIYLNQAGTSWPKPEPVRAAVAAALTSSPLEWAEIFDAQHRAVAAAFGVLEPSSLLLTPGATSALSAAFASVPWKAGDRVIISGLEHQALAAPAHRLTDLGVEVVVAPRTRTGPIDLDAVDAELRRGGVRLVAATAASNVTGAILPFDELVRLAHRAGALCLIDAAQVAGWLPLDLHALAADFVAFAGHKGPHAPWGIGGLYVAPTAPSRMPGYCDVGSVDRAALAGLVAGLEWLDAPARAQRLDRARALTTRLAARVSPLPGCRLHGSTAPDASMPTLALTIDGHSPAALAAALSRRGVIASGGHQCAALAHETLGTAAEGVLRFSVGPFNVESDIDDAASALAEVL